MKVTNETITEVVTIEKKVGVINLQLSVTEAAMIMGMCNLYDTAAFTQINHQNLFKRLIGRECGTKEAYSFCCKLHSELDKGVQTAQDID
jgi:hypothetical protein